MAPETKRRATYADLEKLPENMVGEIINGELIATPRPAPPHANAHTAIVADIGGAFRGPSGGAGGPGGWWILTEPELRLGQDVLVPDVGGWRRERMQTLPRTVGIELPPDWVCEVVSPSTERIDRARKMKIYARVNVLHFWIVNPLQRTLEVHRLDGGLYVTIETFEGDAKVRAAPFQEIELDLSRWWLSE